MNRENERRKLLGEEPIGKLLVKFSLPAITGMIVNALYNIVDRIFIGKGVGELAIGGLFISSPISLIIMAFGMLIGIGGNTLVSIKLGQDRKEEAEKVTGNSFVLLILISLCISVFGLIFLKPLLNVFGASPSNYQYAYDYMKIILIGAPLQAIGFGMNNFIRGEGSPTIAMKTMLIGAISNTILDPIFIFWFNMGVEGAALATIISQGLSALWVMRYFFGGKSMLNIKKEYLKLKLEIAKDIVLIGLGPFSMQIAGSMVTVLLNNSLKNYGGDLANSSMAVINSVAMMVMMPVFGINQGSQPIIGFNYGAQKYDRVKETLKYATIAATAITTMGFLLTQLFPAQLYQLFISKEGNITEILKIGIPGMRIYLAMFPIVGFQVVSSNYFQATGRPKHAMLLSLSRQVLVLIPALIILPKIYGLTGVWLAGPISDLIASIITVYFVIKSVKNLVDEKDPKFNNIIEEN
ncbi:MATE family efflux transporter [Tissierella carlieri]|uniref:Multidrug export protein MepA n=1 Tax=Tissierella carlieri TaxID=689904 RepID=A0ABT1SAB0_9FIRM|nr:MATE family efflux transporter [Tissierella carlieri]MCQ4923272.1 MATE family efflux transporter [Tissierella carlieri]